MRVLHSVLVMTAGKQAGHMQSCTALIQSQQQAEKMLPCCTVQGPWPCSANLVSALDMPPFPSFDICSSQPTSACPPQVRHLLLPHRAGCL
jgi:hypothetical protein